VRLKLREHIALLAPEGSVGAEVGVATGQFSKRILELDHFDKFYSVDRWSDHHGIIEETGVRNKLAPYDKCTVVKNDAIKWLDAQEDESFGFIYIDCYAHTGQEGGSIIDAAWPKIQKGGMLAGDDYEPKYPLTIEAVDSFADRNGLSIRIYDRHLDKLHAGAAKSGWDRSRSWYVEK